MEVVGEVAFSEFLKLVIVEAKKVTSFKSLSRDLASRMERLIPLSQQIDLLYNKMDLPKGELQILIDTIQNARELIQECSQVSWFDIVRKSKYTRKINNINKYLVEVCQMDLQLLLSKYQLQSKCLIESLNTKIDGLNVGGNQFTELCTVPELKQPVTIGLDRPLMELKQMLFVEGTSTVVVSAPPGCGKTTLVTKLCHDEEVKRKFKKIFYIVVSKSFNTRLIVQKLLKHNGYEAPAFGNDKDALSVLQHLLKQIGRDSSILLVLDDVWDGAESLLQNFVVQLTDYKILTTSRFEFPSFGPTYHLKTLNDEDAKTLLIKWASLPAYNSRFEFDDLLQKILKRCNGFPLAIEVVGRSLRGRSLSSWKSLIVKWSEGDKILNTPNPDVLNCMQTSIDALGIDLKECFLDMGSFLEDQKIRASTIIDIWVELYGLDEDFLAMKFLEDLSSQNLLTLITLGRNEHENNFFNEFMVTQHDILRELAVYENELEPILERKRLNLDIRNDKFPDWCSDLSQPFNVRLLSISTDDSFSSRWVDMNFPKVEALVLNFSSSSYALPSFVSKMEKLKVLTFTNHGFFPAKVINFPSIGLLSNLKRLRLEKTSMNLFDISRLQLRNLEKLSMVLCNIGEEEVFYDFEIDISNALPRLQEIDIDYCNDLVELPYWICEVVSLKKLSIANCNKLCEIPEAIGNLINLELLRLSSCISLSGLPENIMGLCNLRYLDVSDCIGLKELPTQIGVLSNLRRISMRKCGNCELPDSIRNLENLEVNCDEEIEVRWRRFKPTMRNLTVHVEESKHSLNWLKML